MLIDLSSPSVPHLRCWTGPWLVRIMVCRLLCTKLLFKPSMHDDVIKWKHFLRYWPFVRGIHRSPVNSPHKGQWRGTLMSSLICVWINGWVNREAGDLRRYRGHYDVIVMELSSPRKMLHCKNTKTNQLQLTHFQLKSLYVFSCQCIQELGWGMS